MSLNTKFFTAVLLLVSITVHSYSQDIGWYKKLASLSPKQAHNLEQETLAKLELAGNSKDTAELILLKNTLGIIQFKQLDRHQEGIENLFGALTLELHARLTEQQVFTYLAIGEALTEIGGYVRAKEAIRKAIAINKSADPDLDAYLLNALGITALRSKHFDQAFEAFQGVLDLEGKVEDNSIIADAYYNRGVTNSEQSQYDAALKDHKAALAIRRQLTNERAKAESHIVIGQVYLQLKNSQRALDNYKVALEIFQARKDTAGLAGVLNNIGTVYLDQRNFEEAISRLEIALDYARSSGATQEIKAALFNLSAAYKGIGDFQRALRYKDDFHGIMVMTNEEEDRRDVVMQHAESEIGLRESQLANLEALSQQKELEIENQKRFQSYLQGIIALGSVVVLLILFLYISNRRSTMKLRVINQKVQEQNLQLQELNATKDKFFSIISHDLKGPLNSLTSFSGLLINHTDSLSKDEIQLLAKDLDKSVKNLFNLLENLLEWSRSQTGNIEFKGERFDVGALLDLNKQLLETQAQTKKITITNSNEKQCFVNVHKHSINTVIRNLMSNAIKFTPAGGKITLALMEEQNNVKISISDTGVGMTPEVIDKLFKIDTKITTKGTADEKGTGLGLILCKDFVEKNGGRIWVESTPGKGSSFHFTLPVLQEEHVSAMA
jgi:signal transduction histidine kinase